MQPGEGVAVQDHQVVGHVPGHRDLVPHQLLVHVEQHIVRIPATHRENLGPLYILNATPNSPIVAGRRTVSSLVAVRHNELTDSCRPPH